MSHIFKGNMRTFKETIKLTDKKWAMGIIKIIGQIKVIRQ